jgi:predicted dehydrogenase
VLPCRDPVPIGVIGLGRIGRQHALNAVVHAPACRLLQVCDTDGETCRRAGLQLGVPWTDDPERAVANPALEGVVVATPVGTHARLVEAALRAGKHVLCEKPLAPDADAVRGLLRAADACDRHLQVGFQMRFDPDLARVHGRIAAGELGDVTFLEAVLRDREPPAPEYLAGAGGLLLDGAVHTLDLARWLGGEIEEVTAVGAGQLVLVLGFASGALGALHHSRSAGYGFDARVEVMGTRATVRVAGNERSHVTRLSPEGVATDHVGGFLERFAQAYVLELEHFGRAIRTGTAVSPGPSDALAAAVLCEAAEASIRERATVRIGGT